MANIVPVDSMAEELLTIGACTQTITFCPEWLIDAVDAYNQAPDSQLELQLAAARERFAERRQQVALFDKRARNTGIDSIESVADAGYRDVLVPVLETSALGRHRRVALESDLCVIRPGCKPQALFARGIGTVTVSRPG